jgi:hypothetical protein
MLATMTCARPAYRCVSIGKRLLMVVVCWLWAEFKASLGYLPAYIRCAGTCAASHNAWHKVLLL